MEDNTVPPPVAAPPPLSPPPVIAPPTPGPGRRRGRGWMIFALVVLVLLGFSVLLNLGHLMRGLVPVRVTRLHQSGPRLEEVVTEDNDVSTKIAVIKLEGLITSEALDQGGFSM